VSIFFGYFQMRFWAPGPGRRHRPRTYWSALRAFRRAPNDPRSEASEAAGTPAASIDLEMMTRCIEISREAATSGELPFAAIVCKEGRIIAESSNRVVQDGDVSRHAEILALSLAQRIAGSKRLRGYTLYTNVEPCPMCAFAVRETGISRVVYAIRSPVMGGHSRWAILEDDELSRVMPIYFSAPPEIVAGFCSTEAEKVWHDRHPLMWKLIKARGGLG
jgi:tRNA(adenine34) deaminase